MSLGSVKRAVARTKGKRALLRRNMMSVTGVVVLEKIGMVVLSTEHLSGPEYIAWSDELCVRAYATHVLMC